MNDREMLELAAKAAGIEWTENDEAGNLYEVRHDLKRLVLWGPLADDGDALRLAVKLRLEICVFRDHSTAYHASGWCDENHAGNENAATRRAIVRAAAEIGRGM